MHTARRRPDESTILIKQSRADRSTLPISGRCVTSSLRAHLDARCAWLSPAMGNEGSQIGVRRMRMNLRGRSDTSPLQSRAMSNTRAAGTHGAAVAAGSCDMLLLYGVHSLPAPIYSSSATGSNSSVSGFVRLVAPAAWRIRIAAAVTVAAARLMLRGALLRPCSAALQRRTQ